MESHLGFREKLVDLFSLFETHLDGHDAGGSNGTAAADVKVATHTVASIQRFLLVVA